jgi:hypothetical protein
MNDTFALSTGQAHKLEMAFRRTGWDNAEIEVLCMGNNLALVKDLINGKLDYTYKQTAAPAAKPEPQPLLIPVGTVDVVATSTQFVAREKFVINTKRNAPVKIAYLDDNFKAWMLGKTEAPFAGSTLKYGKLSRYSVDGPIIAELSGAMKARTTLAEIFRLLEAQKHGGDGPLLTNGYANIFYVEDEIRLPEDEQVAYTNEAGENVVLRAVSARWNARGVGWGVGASSVLDPSEWVDDDRVFSRDSRLPSAA